MIIKATHNLKYVNISYINFFNLKPFSEKSFALCLLQKVAKGVNNEEDRDK